MRPTRALVVLAAIISSASLLAQTQTPRSPAPRSPIPDLRSPVQIQPAAVLNQYCVTCHNERLKTGGVVIDPASLASIGAGSGGSGSGGSGSGGNGSGGNGSGGNAEHWEKIVRKLRTASMPPAGLPRPDEATYTALIASLESTLDRVAAARPQLGTVPLVHRLSRTEYSNAVRDLLALEALPREASVEYLLPADNISSGFDNIADLLFVSPSNMERYLDAARKISRLAVGDPAMPVMVNIHRIDPEHPQDERVDELPFGTRGGIAIRSEFPVDGNYVVKVELAAAPRDPQQLEVTVDGQRVRVQSLGLAGARGQGGRGQGGGRGQAGPSETELEYPIAMKAGTKLIGVAFVQRTEARDEATLRPRTRSRGTQPAIATVTISGPYDALVGGDSPSRRRIFVCRPDAAGRGDVGRGDVGRGSRSSPGENSQTSPAEEACARRILSTLARRAYRRPVADVDVQDLMPFYAAGRAEGSFDLGIQKAIERLLVSSQFLFRIERVPAGTVPGRPYRVTDLELASRLSFFLWSSIPDEELLNVAAAGRLKDPATLEQQVRRMLADPRASAMVTNFAAQWLYLRDIDAKLPDEVLFQDFDETLRQALKRETELFVDSVFRENRSVIELLTANYTFLNERLAKHYGIPNIRGSYFRRVTLPEGSVRGGLLGHGSVLTITSYSTRTSPVLRGKWVLENLLSAAPPPPPADIPALRLEATEPGKVLTLREAMARHRAAPACAGCHARMDPIGFAMENFDAVGRWRDRDGENAIDANGVFPEGTRFDGVAGLKRELIRRPDQFIHTVADRLLMYSIGRNLQYYDVPSVRTIVRGAAPAKYTLSSLVLGVVKSRPFQMRAE